MSDTEESAVPTKKETAVLTDASFKALAIELGPLGLQAAMYLNIPTTQLVLLRLAAGEKESSEEDMTVAALQFWRNMRETAKERDKIYDLERALREAGKQDAADTLLDRHRDDMELTEDCFPVS